MTFRIATLPAMVLTASLCLIAPANAQKKKTANQNGCGQVTITDAAGRTHKVMKMRCITPAQRKAAAKRAAATRAAAGFKAGR